MNSKILSIRIVNLPCPLIFSIFYLYLFWKKIPVERKETISDMIKHNRCQSNPIFFNIPYFFPYLFRSIDYASNSMYHTPTTMY